MCSIARFSLLLLALLGAAEALRAQEAVALFTHADRSVVAVGEPFAYHIEALLAYDSAAEGARLERSFRGAALSDAPGVAIIREEVVRVGRRPSDGVTEVQRTIWLRATEPAALVLPTLTLGDETAAAPTVWAHAGSTLPIDTAAVLPVVAEWETGPPDRRRIHRRIGSAFVVGPAAVATAFHVVVGAARIRLTLPGGHELVTDEVWALDPARDVAIFHADADALHRAGLRPLTPAPPQAFAAEGAAFTAGWPNRERRVTSARRFPEAGLPGLVVAANGVGPGDSGGPLLDAAGRVLGVVSFGRSTDGTPDALPAPVCLATDLRPALIETAAREADGERPRLLARALRDVADEPQARALALVAALDSPAEAAPSLLSLADVSPDLDPLAALATATAAAPADPSLAFLEGTARLQAGDAAGARTSFRRALRHQPAYFPATYALAHLAFEQGELEESEALYAQLDGPYAALGAFGLARIHSERGRHATADRALRDVLAFAPEYAPALFLLGHSRIGQGDVHGAEALAIRLNRLSLGWAERLRAVLELPPLAPSVLEAPPEGTLAVLNEGG